MESDVRGVALILCAPSATGKSTLIKRLTSEFPDFAFSISYTTRPPRSGEQDGREYHFVSREEFIQLTERNFFAEWAQVHSNFYGTPLRQTLDRLAAGRDMLFDIDVQGARQLKENLKVGAYVFLLPPSKSDLKRRMDMRDSESEAVRAERLQKALDEIRLAREFDYWIVNDDLDRAYASLRCVYQAEKCRPKRNEQLLAQLLAEWEG
jgi:guanylate kinase